MRQLSDGRLVRAPLEVEPAQALLRHDLVKKKLPRGASHLFREADQARAGAPLALDKEGVAVADGLLGLHRPKNHSPDVGRLLPPDLQIRKQPFGGCNGEGIAEQAVRDYKGPDMI